VPFKVVGNVVYHFKNGKWSVKQVCANHNNAVEAVGLLHAKGYGSQEKKKKKRR
jgi:hypothetical protein